jgi:hypothetical protein
VPPRTLHTFRNATFVPSGFERFFRDFGHPARLEDVEPLPVQESELQRLRATAGEYGTKLGP